MLTPSTRRKMRNPWRKITVVSFGSSSDNYANDQPPKPSTEAQLRLYLDATVVQHYICCMRVCVEEAIISSISLANLMSMRRAS